MNRLQLLNARSCSFGRAVMLAILAVPLVFALSALGQSSSSFDLSWHTADGGGVTSISSVSFQISGTIGQPDAGEMSGATFALTGGFWFGIIIEGCEIVGMESCMTHDAPCGDMCLPIGCDTNGLAPHDNVEPRLQLGTPPTLVLDLGTCGCDAGEASVTVTCWDGSSTQGVAATVNCDGSSTATVTFDTMLPDEVCCTLTFSGDIVDVRTIVMLETDVDYDCFVTSADDAAVTQRMGLDPQVVGARYDVDRDCYITSADEASVIGRMGRLAPCPCPCP